MSREEKSYGGMFDIYDNVISSFMKKYDINKTQVEKVKEVIDMIQFIQDESGQDTIRVNIGSNVEIKIKK